MQHNSIKILSCVMLVVVLLTSCSFNSTYGTTVKGVYETFGTSMSFSLSGPSRKVLDETVNEIEEMCDRLDGIFSYDSEISELSYLNENAYQNAIHVSDELFYVIQKALYYCSLTNGALDISIGKLIELWHVNSNDGEIPTESDIKSLLSPGRYSQIVLNENTHEISYQDASVSIHLGSVAKGYLAAKLKEIVIKHGCIGTLNIGGNLQTIGLKNGESLWKLAITDPADTNKIYCSFDAGETSVVTSGDYERFFEVNGVRYHHIIDPATGYPADSGIRSVSIIGEDSMVCDALSTACFVLGSEEAIKLLDSIEGYDCIIILSDHSYVTSESFNLSGCQFE